MTNRVTSSCIAQLLAPVFLGLSCTAVQFQGEGMNPRGNESRDERSHAVAFSRWFHQEYPAILVKEIRVRSPLDWPQNRVSFSIPSGEVISLSASRVESDLFSAREIGLSLSKMCPGAMAEMQSIGSDAFRIEYPVEQDGSQVKLLFSPLLDTSVFLVYYLDVELDAWFSDEWIVVFGLDRSGNATMLSVPFFVEE